MRTRMPIVLAALLLCGLLLSGVVLALSEQSYDLDWWSVDGGGEISSTGGGYSLGASIGQPDAGLLTSGGYALSGGFWGGGALSGALYSIYLPLILN